MGFFSYRRQIKPVLVHNSQVGIVKVRKMKIFIPKEAADGQADVSVLPADADRFVNKERRAG
jgi:predicted secreted protein